jgi:DNA-directed RNA polymerase subunit RPC12/RpoP
MTTLPVHCAECEASFKIIFDEANTEGEVIYCPFCGEKLNLKDEKPQTHRSWNWDDEEDDHPL